jgi:hypothetical protein
LESGWPGASTLRAVAERFDQNLGRGWLGWTRRRQLRMVGQAAGIAQWTSQSSF